MIYRRLFFVLICFSLLISERYIVDINESNIFWIGRKITGEHFGTIKVKEGYIDINDNKINNGNIVIDMTSIKVLDIEEEKWNKKLEGHLKNSDFFDVEIFPEASFSINGYYDLFMIESLAIKGNITIKDQVIDIVIPSIVSFDGDYAESVGVVDIDRTKFGITYGSGTFFEGLADKAINDNFTLKFKIVAKKND